MIFKTYLKLVLSMSIQDVKAYGKIETETSILEALTSIWKLITGINNNTVILAWYINVEDIVRPLKRINLVRVMKERNLATHTWR